MSTVRAMAVFQGFSGLPEDQFVATFYFLGGGTYAEDLLLSRVAVENFYTVTPAGSAMSPGSMLSPWIKRPFVIKTYDMTAPKVRVPTNYDAILPAPDSNSSMPEEVALCISLHGATPPASARRRGRLFHGPLNNNPIGFGSATARPTPAIEARNALASAAQDLIDVPLIQWSIRSTKPAENYVPIVGGYIDDAFDTQRRRGTKPTGRIQFIATP